MSTRLSLGVIALLGLGPGVGRAETQPQLELALVWTDPLTLAPSTAAEFDAELSARLGRSAFVAASAGRPVLEVAWAGDAQHCRVMLRFIRGSEVEGTRSIASPSGDCQALGPALLTVAALLIESQRSDTSGNAEEEPRSRVAEPASPAPAARKAALAEQPPPPRVPGTAPRALLSLGGQILVGLAPKLELGPALSLALTPLRHVRLGLQASLFLPRDYGSKPGFGLSHATGMLLACGMPLEGSLGFGACASATLHRYEAAGIGLPHPEETLTYATSLGLGVRSEWHIGRRLWWVASAGAELAPTPLYFHFTPAEGGETQLFRQSRLSPTIFLGLSLELP